MNKAKFNLDLVVNGEHEPQLEDGTKLTSFTIHHHVLPEGPTTIGTSWQTDKDGPLWVAFDSKGYQIEGKGQRVTRMKSPKYRLVSTPKKVNDLESLIYRYWSTKAEFARDCGVSGALVSHWVHEAPNRALMHMGAIVAKTGLTPTEIYDAIQGQG